jgi:hypothetical protein
MLKRAKLNLCDLAGSEKIINKEEGITKAHFNELRTINLSLTTLGKVISALAKGSSRYKPKDSQDNSKLNFYERKFGKKNYGPSIPYRESKLTRLLQDSLGGNTRTCLIATVSSLDKNLHETISTLKFADRAKQVMVKIKVNELDAADQVLVQKLHKEVLHLRQVLNLRKRGKLEEVQVQLMKLQSENNKLRELAGEHNEIEQLKLENKIMKMELQKIKYDDGSQMMPENENLSYNETSSQVNTQIYELNSIAGKLQSEIEKPFDNDTSVK